MNVEEALPGFIAECSDLLKEMEAGLLQCGSGADPETIHLIFRTAHTIKGSAGLFGLEPIVRFVHGVETALDAVRRGRLAMSEELISLLLRCKDHIAALLAEVEAGSGVPPELDAHGSELAAALGRAVGIAAASRDTAPTKSTAGSPAPVSRGDEPWRVCVRFGEEVLKAGMDPLAFIRYLATFAEIESITVLEDALPALEQFDPELCYLGFDIDLRTSADRERIEAVFEFVREDCVLQVERRGRAQEIPTLEKSEKPDSTGSASALAPSQEPARRDRHGAASRSIRVDADKVDHLITGIGELIIAAAGAQLAARRSGDADLEEQAATLAALVEQVRESALQLRMVKIGGVFERFRRIVHDLSRELGKEIALVVKGEDTELDKTLVERVADPLTHLVRNAMDHGIEPADQRRARGKPPVGTVTLNAYHDSGNIVIEVADDGRGLQRDRILAKAVERGLIDAGRELTESEVFNLIFEPGLSTAGRVTDLSGRGVGMDVVRRNITALRGNITVQSSEGTGTTIAIRLPLTLAIINGFQVGVGRSTFVLPLESIDECVELAGETGHDFTALRGAILPFVRLRDVFGTQEPAARRQSIVVVRHGAERAGLVVDALLGELQTVIKPLGKIFRNVQCVTGSSILGNGEVALILDVPALISQAAARARRSAELSDIRIGG